MKLIPGDLFCGDKDDNRFGFIIAVDSYTCYVIEINHFTGYPYIGWANPFWIKKVDL